MRYAYAVTTWSGAKLVETVHSVPKGARLLVVDNSQLLWSLARCWNYAITRLLGKEAYDAVICMNDDVILRADTGELMARALLEWQHAGVGWTDRELLIVSARHAAPTDARTDEVDYGLLDAAVPRWEAGPDFACFAVGHRLFAEVGQFDEDFALYHEDNDMHRRIQLAGFEAGAYAPYWHYLNGTIRTDPERRLAAPGLFQQTKQKYIEKWGGYLQHERYATPYGR